MYALIELRSGYSKKIDNLSQIIQTNTESEKSTIIDNFEKLALTKGNCYNFKGNSSLVVNGADVLFVLFE